MRSSPLGCAFGSEVSIAGTLIGLGVGLAIDGAVGIAAVDWRWNPSYTELGGILAVTTATPPALGYYYGRRADEDWTTITIERADFPGMRATPGNSASDDQSSVSQAEGAHSPQASLTDN